MNYINTAGGFCISVYHSFHDEVDHFRSHWWQCYKCKNIIKRAMNRAPGPSDWWFPRHQRDCGGNYVKIRSPPTVENTKKRKREDSIGNGDEEEPNMKKPKSLPSTPATHRTSRKPSIFDSWRNSPPSKPADRPIAPKPNPKEQSSAPS
jgi:hypothetical protein